MKFSKLEIEERDKDDPTHTFIKDLLSEEQTTKKQKRGDGGAAPLPLHHARVPLLQAAAKQAAGGPPAKRARPEKKTLAEIEEEEGGPIKESLVGVAHAKRALDRKKPGDANTDDVDFKASLPTETGRSSRPCSRSGCLSRALDRTFQSRMRAPCSLQICDCMSCHMCTCHMIQPCHHAHGLTPGPSLCRVEPHPSS